MLTLDALINAMVTGLFVGAGSAIGTWIVTRHFLRTIEVLEKKLIDKKNSNANGNKEN